MRRSSAVKYFPVIFAAFLWSFLGPTYTVLFKFYHLPLISIIIMRSAVAGVILAVAGSCCYRDWFSVKRHHIPFFLFYGVICTGTFFIVYLKAVQEIGIALGAVLLYTAPAWVALISWKFLSESLNTRLVLAVVLSFVGAALVSGVYKAGHVPLNWFGIAMGLGSGFLYALWSISNRIGVKFYGYSSWSLQMYGFLIGAVFLGLVQSPGTWFDKTLMLHAMPVLLFLGAGPGLFAAVAYGIGVKLVPVSRASVIATLEPVLATVWAVLFFHERLDLLQTIGGLLIIVSVIIITSSGQEDS